jgi:gliding motility-associated-like protein
MRKKKKYILLIVLFLNINFGAFPQLKYQKIIEASKDIVGNSLLETENNYLVGGYSKNFIDSQDLFFFRININNPDNYNIIVIDNKTPKAATKDIIRDMAKSLDGGIMITGESKNNNAININNKDMLLANISGFDNNNITKSSYKLIGNTGIPSMPKNEIGLEILQLADQSYISGGIIDYPQPYQDTIFIMRSNQNKEILWNKKYSFVDPLAQLSIIEDKNNNLVALITDDANGKNGTDLVLYKFDKNGENRIIKYYDIGSTDVTGKEIIETYDGYLILVNKKINGTNTDILVLKLDKNLNAQWYNIISSPGKDIGVSIVESIDSNYVIAGYTNDASAAVGSTDAFLLKMDHQTHNIIWQRSYGYSTEEVIHDMIQTRDHGFCMVGSTSKSINGGNNKNLYIIKTNRNGESGCNEKDTVFQNNMETKLTWNSTSNEPFWGKKPEIKSFSPQFQYPSSQDSTFCEDTVISPFITVNAGNDASICRYDSVYIGGHPTAYGGYPPYTYTWLPATNIVDTLANPLVSPADTTTYYVTVTDQKGNSDYDSCTVNITPDNAEYSGLDSAYCLPANKDTLTPLYPEGIFTGPGVTYNDTVWIFDPQLAGAGVHQVKCLLCNDSVVKEVVVVDLNYDLGTDTTLCYPDTAYLDAGANFKHYNWNTGDTSRFYKVTSNGQYKVTVTDKYGCVANDSIYATLSSIPSIKINNDTAVCYGDSVVLNAPTGFNSYLWNTGDTSESIIVDTTGAYSITITNSDGCSNEDTSNVITHYLPDKSMPVTNAKICEGDSASFSLINTTVGIKYLLKTSTNTTFDSIIGTGDTVVYSLLPEKDTTFFFIAIDTTTGCQSQLTDTAQIIMESTPDTTLTVTDTSICNGGEAAITIKNTENGIDYYLRHDFNDSIISSALPGDGTDRSFTVAPTDTILYNVFAMSPQNACNHELHDKSYVPVIPMPNVNLGSDTAICAPDSLVLIPKTAPYYDYEWNDGATDSVRTIKSSGQYILTITSGNKCASADTVQIVVDSLAIVDAGKDITVCANQDEVQLNGSISGGSAVGIWSTSGDGTFTPNHNQLDAKYKTLQDTAGSTILLTLTSEMNGACKAVIDTLTLYLKTPPNVEAGNDTLICNSEAYIHLGGKSNNNYPVKWTSSGDGRFSPADTLAEANYYLGTNDKSKGQITLFLATQPDTLCSPDLDSLRVSLENIHTDFAYNDSCTNEPVHFTERCTVSHGGNIIQYLWEFPDSSNQTGGSAQNTFTSSGINPVKLTATSSNGCIDSAIKNITIYPQPTAHFIDSSTCNHLYLINQSVIATGSIDSYYWKFDDGNTSIEENPVLQRPLNPSINMATLIVHSAAFCSDTTTDSIYLKEVPLADFELANPPYYINEPVQFVDLSNKASSWLWTFDDGSTIDTNQNTVHTYDKTGNFDVTLEVRSKDNCSDITSKTITIANNAVLPTAFTPNNDGINDRLSVLGGPFKSIKLQVYNKNGKLLFETNQQNKGWNGQYKGQEQPIGVYFYIIEGIKMNNEPFNINGEITLIR